MDAYAMGLVALVILIILITVSALFFISVETSASNTDTRSRTYARVKRVDTNTIETVDAAGQVQRWQRLV